MQKLQREPEFKEALEAAHIDATDLTVTREMVKVLYELQQ